METRVHARRHVRLPWVLLFPDAGAFSSHARAFRNGGLSPACHPFTQGNTDPETMYSVALACLLNPFTQMPPNYFTGLFLAFNSRCPTWFSVSESIVDQYMYGRAVWLIKQINFRVKLSQ